MNYLYRLLMVVVALVCLSIAWGTTDWITFEDGVKAYSKRAPKHQQPGGYPTISVANLPPQAQQTLRLIKRGGPFPYRKDGTTFFNREKRLPQRKKGYYREYTVKTPGRRGRGARRIVAGSNGEYYYTHDHYRTFKLIKE